MTEERVRAAIRREFNVENMEALARRINAHERSGSYRGFGESAALCADELRRAGLERVELIAHPADGVTTNMDFTMPQAWEAEEAELAVSAPAAAAQPLIDFPAMPLSLANRCAPTPQGGVEAEVITIEQLFSRANAAGALVYTAGRFPEGWGRPESDPARGGRSLLAEAAAKGVLGYISDYSPARELDPNATFWINGWGSPGWHQTHEDARMCCFSITPAKGALLGHLLEQGAVRVRARVRARIYDGNISTVTVLLPGRQEREIVLLAHIYEPFLCDDAVGAAALVEIGRTLKALRARGELPQFEFGIRLLIGMERYGFAAYFAQEQARQRALLGISMDSICLAHAQTQAPVEVRLSAPSLPFWGDLLLSRLAQRELADTPTVSVPGSLSDDTFISDCTIGIPSQWVWTRVGATHHSSLWLDEAFNDWPLGADIARLITLYVVELAAAEPNEQQEYAAAAAAAIAAEGRSQVHTWAEALQRGSRTRRQVQRLGALWLTWQRGRAASLAAMVPGADSAAVLSAIEEIQHALEQLTAGCAVSAQPASAGDAVRSLVLQRVSLGMPFSQARIPKTERITENYEQALNWADGTRTLEEIAALAQPLASPEEDEVWLQRFARYCRVMACYGYLKFVER